jgi:twitching motility protein PilT
MIKHMNTDLSLHIITLEDPIEYMHDHGTSIIDQREVGFDTKSFTSGLRAALRQDPDVILVGEMRDLETIGIAITAAETGHLVLGTLHTSSAASTIERIIDVFSPEQQAQVRTQLGGVLKAVISQRLIKTVDGKGRRAATEILISNSAIANLIRTAKVHQIPNVIMTNRALGMHMMAMSVKELVESGQITQEMAQPYLEGEEH